MLLQRRSSTCRRRPSCARPLASKLSRVGLFAGVFPNKPRTLHGEDVDVQPWGGSYSVAGFEEQRSPQMQASMKVARHKLLNHDLSTATRPRAISWTGSCERFAVLGPMRLMPMLLHPSLSRYFFRKKEVPKTGRTTRRASVARCCPARWVLKHWDRLW